MAGFSVKKPLTIFVTVLGIIVLGVVAYLKMTPDLLPNMDFPYVIIVTSDPGASPESIEQSITRPVEQSMATLDKIKTVTSTSQDSVSMVTLEFEDGANMDTISVDIQQKISVLQGSWDDTVSAPYVLKINPSMLPVMVAAVTREDMDVYALSDFVTGELSPKLEGVSGVASISVSGAVTREAHVILDEAKLDALSEKLADAVRTELNKRKLDLQKAKDQVEKGQAQLDEAKEAIAAGAAAKAGAAVDKLYEYLKEARGQIPEPDPDPDPGEPPITVPGQKELEQLQKTLKRLNATLDKLMKDLESGELKREVTSEVYNMTLSLIDGITQLTEAQIQLDEAMTQIEAGMDQINEAYKSIADQTDVGGMLSISAVSQLLTAQNFAMPAGYIEDDSGVKYMVSVGENVSSRQELEDMVLLDLGMDGIEPVTLGDIATVVVTDNAGELYTKVNGDNGILITFTKQSNYATAEVSNNISARFEELEGQYEGLSFAPLMDQGDYIYLIVETITSSLLWGALFSVVILYLFLRDWRPTVITLVSIPVSVIFAIVLMYFTGVTINMISLSGLAVAVGMLVDNSVVVIENIYRLRAKGANVIQAAVSGAKQVAGAVTASTLTTVCVFLPIVFVTGITRQLFTDLALTMTYSLLASLIVSLTLVPAMASGMLRKEHEIKPGLLEKHLLPAYRRAVKWSLGHKPVVLIVSAALLVVTALGSLAKGFIFMPDMDMPSVNVTLTMPEDADMAEATALADQVLDRIGKIDGIETVGAMMGGSSSMLSMGSGESHDVTVYITLSDDAASGAAVGRQIEEACADLPCEVTTSSAMMDMSMLTGSGVSVNVYSDDMDTLQSAAAQVGKALADIPGVAEVSDGLEDATPALHVAIDRNAAMKHGLTVAQIYMELASGLTDNATAATLELDGVSTDVIIEKPEDSVLDVDALRNYVFEVTKQDGTVEEVPLRAFALVRETSSLGSIHRMNQKRYLSVTATLEEGYNVTLITAKAQDVVGGLDLGDGVSYTFTGENETIMEAVRQLLLMLVLGILLVYLVMVAQFQSLKSPFIVMFTIPLAFTGGFMALLLGGMEISVISLIGFVMLTGIIVNNGIVLVDYINQLRQEGVERREAIEEAGVTRMRPILMTTITTVLGLVDMAVHKTAGTSLMKPVAIVCIGGLVYATLMTLFVVPCIYDTLNKKELRSVREEDLKLLDL